MAAKVDDKAGWYIAQAERWEVARLLLGGTEALRKAACYLPRFPLEPTDAYDIRLQNSTLTNVYTQIAMRMIGLVFRVPVKVSDSEIPEEVLNNIDNRGRSVHAFAELIAMQALTRGIHHILVDAPENPGTETLEDDKKAGLRPFWVSVAAETCKNAFATTKDNQEVLGQVRYQDDTASLEGFEVKPLERIRVLTLKDNQAQFEVWTRPAGDGEYSLDPTSAGEFKAKGGKSLTRLPWVTVYGARREAFMTARSVIQDIAWKNIEHWQSASDQRNILTVARYPMRCEVGTQEPQKAAGPHIVLHSQGNANTHQEAKFYYIEPTGAGIQAGERDLERLVAEMEMLAIQLRVDPQQTATGADITQGSTTSNLVTFAHGIEAALQEALNLTADYYGIDRARAGKVTVNKDFTLTAEESARALAIIDLLKNGKITLETALKELQAIGYLSPEVDVEKEVESLDDAAPPPPVATPPEDLTGAAA